MASRTGLTRRQGLLFALALPVATAAGCSSEAAPPVPPSPSGVDEDATVVDEQALIGRYEATAAAHPALAEALAPLADQHRAHLAALGSPDAPGRPPTEVPALPSAALAALVQAERSASRQRIDACVAAESGDRARLLAFIAASEAGHVAALTRIDS
jgi:hypothetical protein